jgi:hypothetical protein
MLRKLPAYVCVAGSFSPIVEVAPPGGGLKWLSQKFRETHVGYLRRISKLHSLNATFCRWLFGLYGAPMCTAVPPMLSAVA